MTLTIRSGDPKTSDYERFAELLNQTVSGANYTADDLREWDHNMADVVKRRYAACLDDNVIGYGVIAPEQSGSKRYDVWGVIDPAYRRHGYGRQLADFLINTSYELGAEKFASECMTTDPYDLIFAQKYGFRVRRLTYNSSLDLTNFHADQTWVERAEAQGIRFCSLSMLGDTEENRRKLFTLNIETVKDNPTNDPDITWRYEDFILHVYRASWFRAEGQILAVDGERFVGLGAVGIASDGNAFNAYTGVDRAYRGKGIAQALKVLSVQFAQSNGAKEMRTNNDSENVSMLAINQKMGYIRHHGTYRLVKD